MHGPSDLLQAARRATAALDTDTVTSMLGQPIIVLSAPRAGSNLLFEQLCRLRHVWSIGGESHAVFAAFPHLQAENEDFDSGALGASHADPVTADGFRRCLLFLLRNRDGRPYGSLPAEHRPAPPVWVEKTPRNALNMEFVLALFPGARFVFLHREARANIASLIEAWKTGLRSGRFVTYEDLPDWSLRRWCFLLPPGWRALDGQSLAAIASFQWATANRHIVNGLASLPAERWTSVRYETLVASPTTELARIAGFAGLDELSVPTIEQLPVSRTALTAPAQDKWRQHAESIEAESPRWESVAAELDAL